MRSTYQQRPTSGRPSVWRVTLSIISIIVSALVTIALVVQIFDQIYRQTFVPEHYFWFFSVQTSIANIAILMASGIIGLQSQRDRQGLVVLRGLVVGYSLITMAIYNLLLRSDFDATVSGTVAQWTLEVVHVVVPVYFVLDWLLNPHRRRLTWWFLPLSVIYPAIWFGATSLQGQRTGWYPYAFLSPKESGGWMEVFVVLGFISMFALVMFIAVVLVNRVHQRLVSEPTLRR